MDLQQADKLISDMIKEDDNYTIKDYIELRGELAGITKVSHKPIIRRRKKSKNPILEEIQDTLSKLTA